MSPPPPVPSHRQTLQPVEIHDDLLIKEEEELIIIDDHSDPSLALTTDDHDLGSLASVR